MILATREDDRVVLRPANEAIVTGSLPALRSKLQEIVEEGVRELVLDLSEVPMVDAGGIGLLLATHNSLFEAGGSLTVIHASPEIFELFETLRLSRYFRISEN
jgi:anti-anti-sigma factor